jgi:Protein of unknown function (DUF2934)
VTESLRDGITDCALQTEIRQRAYEIYEAHGRRDGHAFDDWLQAEREITRRETRREA